MANPCSSGVGAANPGAGAVGFLTNIAVSAFLTRIGLGWLAAVTGALPQFAFDVDDFCVDGQPALPTITAADVLALANPLLDPNAGAAGIKVKDLVLHYLWYELCHCASVSTPQPATVQAPPDVIGYGYPSTDACIETPVCTRDGANDFVNGTNPIGIAWPFTPPSGIDCYTYAVVLPTQVRLVVDRVRGATGVHDDPFRVNYSFTYNVLVNVFPNTSQGPAPGVTVLAAGDHFETTLTVPPTVKAFQANIKAVNNNSADTFTFKIYAYCNTLPAPTGNECCPPDPSIAAAIADLAAQLQIVKATADLVQRQAAPFAYVLGDSNNFLSGTGHIDLVGALGCLVVVQALPDNYGIVDGEVDELYTDSWINFGTGTFSGPRRWIRGYSQLHFPRNPGVFDRVSYTLRPGVQVGITPVLPEAQTF